MDLPNPVAAGSECWDATYRIVVDLDAEGQRGLLRNWRTAPSTIRFHVDDRSNSCYFFLQWPQLRWPRLTSYRIYANGEE